MDCEAEPELLSRGLVRAFFIDYGNSSRVYAQNIRFANLIIKLDTIFSGSNGRSIDRSTAMDLSFKVFLGNLTFD